MGVWEKEIERAMQRMQRNGEIFNDSYETLRRGDGLGGGVAGLHVGGVRKETQPPGALPITPYTRNRAGIAAGMERPFYEAEGYHDGGMVPGQGRGDKIPIMAEPGEVVIPKDVVDLFGKEYFLNLIAEGQQAVGMDPEQFQQGGNVPSRQELLEYAVLGNRGMEDSRLRGLVASNQDKDFVQRISSANPTVSNRQRNMDGSSSTHLMGSGGGRAFPQIRQQGGGFTRNRPGSGEEIDMGSDEGAEWFAQNYKRANPGGFAQGYQGGGEVRKPPEETPVEKVRRFFGIQAPDAHPNEPKPQSWLDQQVEKVNPLTPINRALQGKPMRPKGYAQGGVVIDETPQSWLDRQMEKVNPLTLHGANGQNPPQRVDRDYDYTFEGLRPYETDPQRIGDTRTFSGAMKGLVGAGFGAAGNLATDVAAGVVNAFGPFHHAAGQDRDFGARNFEEANQRRYRTPGREPQPQQKQERGITPTAQAAPIQAEPTGGEPDTREAQYPRTREKRGGGLPPQGRRQQGGRGAGSPESGDKGHYEQALAKIEGTTYRQDEEPFAVMHYRPGNAYMADILTKDAKGKMPDYQGAGRYARGAGLRPADFEKYRDYGMSEADKNIRAQATAHLADAAHKNAEADYTKGEKTLLSRAQRTGLIPSEIAKNYGSAEKDRADARYTDKYGPRTGHREYLPPEKQARVNYVVGEIAALRKRTRLTAEQRRLLDAYLAEINTLLPSEHPYTPAPVPRGDRKPLSSFGG